MPMTKHDVLCRVRSKLHFCAALALKNDIDLTAEIVKIFGLQESQLQTQSMIETKIETKGVIDQDRLNKRERLVLETIYESAEPVSINEMLDKFKDKKDTRWSKASITSTVKVLRTLDLISYTANDERKVGYVKKQNGIIEP